MLLVNAGCFAQAQLPQPGDAKLTMNSVQVKDLRRRKVTSPDSSRAARDDLLDEHVARAQRVAWRGRVLHLLMQPQALVEGRWWWAYFWGCCIIGVCLHISRVLVQAPANLPYLHDLLQTSFAFINFAALFVYCNTKQLRIPVEL